MKRNEESFRGCLVGGAIGDAFGAPVKFMHYDKIVELYGENGLALLGLKNHKHQVTITDDTQLTLFTAEGLLRGIARNKQKQLQKNNKDTSIVVFRAYLRWLYTQGLKTPNWEAGSYDGWLVKIKKLHGYRDPGVTCITSLGKGMMGTFQKPINDSKRCGTVIRIAPVGLIEDRENVFEVGARIGAITHGHHTGYYASGTLALMIYYIVEGLPLTDAVKEAVDYLRKQPESDECLELLEKAISLAEDNQIGSSYMHEFGEGFMAHEALAMGVYAALTHQEDFIGAILFAIYQSGNSNSAAVITGSLLGTYLGIDGIDNKLIEALELNKEIDQMGKDLFTKYEDTEEWKKRYPGW